MGKLGSVLLPASSAAAAALRGQQAKGARVAF